MEESLVFSCSTRPPLRRRRVCLQEKLQGAISSSDRPIAFRAVAQRVPWPLNAPYTHTLLLWTCWCWKCGHSTKGGHSWGIWLAKEPYLCLVLSTSSITSIPMKSILPLLSRPYLWSPFYLFYHIHTCEVLSTSSITSIPMKSILPLLSRPYLW